MSQSAEGHSSSASAARDPRRSVAVVGIGCRFAGAADVTSFWKLIVEGRDAFGPVPADRWNHAAVYDPNPRAADKTCTDRGAFIDDIRSFPAIALQVPPRRVEVMDPQQRLTLECALDAIADAGVTPDALPRRTGVYVGVTATEYRTLMATRTMAQLMAAGDFGRAGDPETMAAGVERIIQPRPFTAAGALANMTAAIVAQELQLTGPAYTLDSACSSALVALADAVSALRAGDVEVALAGGAYLQVTPDHYIAFSRIGAMSRAGRCLPFDTRADGFLQGDGGGIVMLKRLADAERDGDRIYAVIDGIALNNDGGGDGPMAPVKSGQVEVIDRAWRDAGLTATDLGYVEAHGTGTSVGDVIEFQGLVERLGHEVRDAAIGSAKANIGHTMSAAGAAGLIRAVLALHHRTRPPMAGFEQPKADLAIEQTRFHVPTSAEPWDAPSRVACVSAFGFGGTNAHVVLSSAPEAPAGPPRPQLVLFSAPTGERLGRYAAALADAVALDTSATPASVARSLQLSPAQSSRAAVVAATRDELVERLRSIAAGAQMPGVAVANAADEPPGVAFLYPGQGAQRIDMAAGLRARFDVVRDVLDACDAATSDITARPLSRYVFPADGGEPIDEAEAFAALTATEHCQPALLATGVALTRLLEQAGVRPSVTAGHSVGEFTAAVTSGVIDVRDGVRWAAARGRAMSALDGDRGAMLAVLADLPTVEALLRDGVVIANHNHPRQFVLSGATAAVAATAADARARGVDAREVRVSHAFHSPILAPVDLDALVDALKLRAPVVPLASCIAPAMYGSAGDARDVFRRHATAPVDFIGAVQRCADAGATVFVQVATAGPLLGFVRGTLRGREDITLVSCGGQNEHDEGRAFFEALGVLWTRGVPVDAAAVNDPAPLTTVPPAPLPREVYWGVKDAAVSRLALSDVARPAAFEREETAAPVLVAEGAAPQSGDSPVAELVFAAVARASSYPRASLRAQMKLSDDLGFDSMMLAELSEELGRTVPGVTGVPRSLLINGPTIGDLIAWCEAPHAVTGGDDDAPLSRYAPVWRRAPLAGTPRPIPGATFAVFGPGATTPVGAELARALAAAGVAAAPSAVAELLVFVAAGADLPTVGAVLAEEAAAPVIEDELFDVVARRAAPRALVLVREVACAWSEGAAGAVRALAREWPDALCRTVALDGLDAASAAAAVVGELRTSEQTVDVRHGSEGRSVAGAQRLVELPDAWLPGADDTVVITGGTRGIGVAVAARLAATGAQIVLVGRGAPGERAEALIAASNGRVRHIAVDVSDRAAVKAALAPVGTATVLVHAAGLLADGPVRDVDAATGRLARAVKTQGFLNALVAVNGSLKVALAVGSWAGRFGGRHQAHYAAANAQMAALVSRLPGRIRGVCAEFGPWAESEMAATIPAAVQSAMRADGIDFVSDAAGLDALLVELGGGTGVVIEGRRVPASTRVLSVDQTLSVETDPYLADHAVDGRPVLPLAGAAALFAAAADAIAPFEVRDMTLFQGVAVTEPVALRVSLRNDALELRSDRTLHYTAALGPVGGSVNDPGPTSGGVASGVTLAEFYGGITFHGPLLQGITSVDAVGDGFVRGRVRVGRPCEWTPATALRAWPLDPLALDSAFQLAAMVAWSRFGRAGTPVSFKRYVQLREFPLPLDNQPAPTVTAECRFDAAEPTGDRFEADVYFRDDAGGLLAVCEGVAAQLVKAVGDETGLPEGFEVRPEWVRFDEWPEYKELALRFQMVEALGLQNPYFDLHQGTARDTSRIGDRDVINFSSYNYLGLSGDPRVIADVHGAMQRYGTSVSASRIASGERPFHRDLEAELARALDVDDCIVFPSGHATNVTVIGHLFGPGDMILHDELIHDSCLQGIKLSGAVRRSFRHEDVDHCESQLREHRYRFQRVLLLTEGVYSMDGDISQTPAFVALKRKYGCMLMIDEAHSFGTVGATGLGVREHHGLAGRDVDLWMGTMSKSLASTGGWIAGTRELVTYLRYTTPGFVFAAGMTPTLGQAALSSLRLMAAEPWRVQRLQANAALFARLCKEHRLEIGVARGESPVVPVITGDSMQALLLSAALLERGINAKPIIFPAVADDAARLRFFLSALHTEEQLRYTVDAIATELAKIRGG